MTAQTRTCQVCGRENDADQDFCVCGEYLRWEPTTHLAAVEPPRATPEPSPTTAPPEPAAPAAAEPPSAPRPEPPTTEARPSATITLRLPDDDDTAAGVGRLEVGVVPGDQVRIIARIRNQSNVVDNYDLELDGVAPEWSTIAPSTVYLVPFGSAGTFEQDVEIVLHPPRAAEAEARLWELRLIASPRARSGAVASVALVLGILPYEQYLATLKPQRASGRRRATLQMAIDNRANAPVAVALGATDADGECRFRFDERVLEVPPGRRATTRLRVRPPRQIWLGRRRERRLEVATATGEEGEKLLAQDPGKGQGGLGGLRLSGQPKIPGVQAPNLQEGGVQLGSGGIDVRMPQMRGPQARGLSVRQPQLDLGQLRMPGGRGADAPPQPLLPTQAVFVQKAWLPWWLAIVVPLLVVAALALVLLLPSNVTVPELRGAPSKFAAQQRLTKAALKIDANDQQVVTGKEKPGTVLGQDPGPGEKVRKGSAVSVQVAVGTGKEKVPSIVGQTFEAAEIRLRRAGFDIGKSSVQPPDLKAKIASQIPLAGDQAPTGAPVDIFYAESKPPKGNGPGGVAPPGVKGSAAVIPAIDPPDVKGYGAKISGAGLVPKFVRRFSDAKPGTVFGVEPAPGTAGLKTGASVNVLVSAGIPRLVYDDDQNVLVVEGATGKRIGAVAKSPKREKDPTFSADGREVVFTEGGQLMSAGMSPLGGQASPLTPTGTTYADPSFAPTSDSSVLASALVNDPATHADTDLCLGKVTQDGYQPECIVDKHFAVGFAHWSPDGRTLLMRAVSTKGFGIVRYHSKVAFSPRAQSWGTGRFVTPRPDVATGVADAAVAPDGKHLAAVANLDTKQFQLYLTTPGDFSLKKATPLPVQGCKIAWRPDGQELTVVQAGADCQQDAGQMIRVPIDKPTAAVELVARGDNPAYQPLQPGG